MLVLHSLFAGRCDRQASRRGNQAGSQGANPVTWSPQTIGRQDALGTAIRVPGAAAAGRPGMGGLVRERPIRIHSSHESSRFRLVNTGDDKTTRSRRLFLGRDGCRTEACRIPASGAEGVG